MADPSTCPPLTSASIRTAHAKIEKYIHRTPVLTCRTIDRIASTPVSDGAPHPRVRIWFKCENMQKIGAFKARGAHYAILRLIDEMGLEHLRKRGVVTHSSGNHAQALALAAKTFDVPAYIVMPTISTPSKIAGTRLYTNQIIFSGSTSHEREAKVAEVVRDTGAILVPPYDHPDIQLGQGTAAFELDEQFRELAGSPGNGTTDAIENGRRVKQLDLVITALGGGGLLSGTCVYFSDQPDTHIVGTEPSFQGADDGKRGLEAHPPKRITTVNSLTIADGVRTPVGLLPWDVFLDRSSRVKPKLLEAVYSVTEEQIKSAMRLLMERMKVFVEPCAGVPLAALLYDEGLRKWIQEMQGGETWDVGIILSGGNTTIETIVNIFGNDSTRSHQERAQGVLGSDGSRQAQNVAG